jgi:hypothetical protein
MGSDLRDVLWNGCLPDFDNYYCFILMIVIVIIELVLIVFCFSLFCMYANPAGIISLMMLFVFAIIFILGGFRLVLIAFVFLFLALIVLITISNPPVKHKKQ